MNRTIWIAIGIAVVVIVLIAILTPGRMRQPDVQIDTEAAKVSIGPGGVSISVPPSP